MSTLFKRIFDSTPDGLLVVDQQGNITELNAQTLRLFGYSREELLCQPIELLVSATKIKHHEAHRNNYLSSPSRRPMGENSELFAKRKDGSEFPVDIQLSPIDNNNETSILCVVRDVSERKQAESKFRGLLESAPDAIVIVNERGEITLINSQTEKLFGYSREELVKKSVDILVPDRFREHHHEYRQGYFRQSNVRPMGSGLDLYGLRKDGSEFAIEISLSPLETVDGRLVSAAIRDITARKNAEQVIKDSLHEKEIMLKEIHHRVKNNLAVIGSLFYLQSTYTDNKQLKEILQKSQDRVRSMAMVHESLYRSDKFQEINFSDYIKKIAPQLINTYTINEIKPSLILDLEDAFLDIESAIPCGLILNEILTNTLKHAFLANSDNNEVCIQVKKLPDRKISIEISDNGVGLPDNTEYSTSKSLGLRLINSLSRQLDGEFSMNSLSIGTQVTLIIPEKVPTEEGAKKP